MTCHSSGLPTPLELLTDCNNMHCLQSRSTLKNDSTGHPPTALTLIYLSPSLPYPVTPQVSSLFSHLTLHCAFSICLYLFHFHTHPASFLNTNTYPSSSPLSSLRSSCAKAFSRLNFAPLQVQRTRVRVVFSGYFVFLCSLCLFSFSFSFPLHFSFRFVCPFLKKPLLLPLFKFNCGLPQPTPPPTHITPLLCCVVNPLRARQTLRPLGLITAPSVAASTNYGLKFKHKFVSNGHGTA